MNAVILDADSLGTGVDFSPIEQRVSKITRWPSTAANEVNERIADADIVLTNKVQLTRASLTHAKNLKWVGVLATGMNNVDLAAADALNITVKNVSAYGTASVAQHTLMLMLALATRLPQYQAAVAAGAWQTSPMFCLMDYPVLQLQGKNLVIVGHGELGQAVAHLEQAFGMQVQVAARAGAKDDARPSLASLLPTADVISFHCPLTEQTRDMLALAELSDCKPSALILNVARGGIVNETAIVHALRQGLIGGYAADVLTVEPPTNGNPLLDALHEGLNLIITPHSAWLAPEARQRIIDLTAENIQAMAT